MSQAAVEWQLVDIRLYFHSRLKLRDISRLWHQSSYNHDASIDSACTLFLLLFLCFFPCFSCCLFVCFSLFPPPPPLYFRSNRSAYLFVYICSDSEVWNGAVGPFSPPFVQLYVLSRMGLISLSLLHFLAATKPHFTQSYSDELIRLIGLLTLI